MYNYYYVFTFLCIEFINIQVQFINIYFIINYNFKKTTNRIVSIRILFMYTNYVIPVRNNL